MTIYANAWSMWRSPHYGYLSGEFTARKNLS